MKKFVCLLLSILLLLPMLGFTALEAVEEPEFNYELSIDDRDIVEVRPGDIITVSLDLKRTDSDESYTMYAMQDEIRYDSSFFKLVEDSAVLAGGVSHNDISVGGGFREYYMNYVSLSGGRTWKADTRVGSFQLEVIAESGMTTITNEDFLVSLPDGSRSYPCEANFLTVIIDSKSEVRFETNGGSDLGSVNVNNGQKLSRPKDPVRDGYRFVGWYKDADLTKAWDFENDTVNEDITLYAKWEEIIVNMFRFELDPNGGSLDPAIDTSGLYSEGTVVGLPVPVREGYAFTGWYNGETPTEIYNAITLTEDTTLTAGWSIIEYTITFNTDGGEAIAPVKYTIESDYELPLPVREDYGFMGWQIDQKDDYWPDEVYDAGTSVLGRQGDIELTAIWSYGFFCEIEDYRYAPEDYVLLRISAEDNTDGYSFDGVPMFYTDDVNYRIDGKGVFLTLISTRSESAGGFNQEVMSKLSRTGVPAETITRDGDVNGDGKTNLEDANIVYLMVKRGGESYSLDQLSIAQRLAADVNTARNPGDNLYRGSLADVNAIVNLFNGAK